MTIVFLEGGKANGLQVKVDHEGIPLYLPDGLSFMKYEEAKPFRLWQGLPVYVEAEIEIPAERLAILDDHPRR